jgi:putative nucleotidyltransferase with HDIG domain
MSTTLNLGVREEITEVMPEVGNITDSDLREKTTDMLTEAPEYFWTAPASKYHHPEEHQYRHGLWLHTKRVCTVLDRIVDSMVEQGHVTDTDAALSAAILHDTYKYGRPPTEVDTSTSDHDLTAGNVAFQYGLPPKVVGAIKTHNGSWYAGPSPSNTLEQTVHIADMVASDPNVDIAVLDPHPILQDQFPRVSER